MSTKVTQIEATLDIVIEHFDGPKIEDADHVRRWICADGQWFQGMHNGFRFEVCPDHEDPDDCIDCIADQAIYAAIVVNANWDG